MNARAQIELREEAAPLLELRRGRANDGYLVKRAFDLALALVLLPICALPMVLLALLIRFTSPGPALHWSERIGIDNKRFRMPKFRSMRVDAPAVATHLFANANDYITPVGRFLRKTSLDELPQLISIIKGDLSFVGPRPALANQADLIALRTERGVHALLPGLTGWAQINGRDELSIPVKVDYDAYYLAHRSFLFDLRIVLCTFTAVLQARGVHH